LKEFVGPFPIPNWRKMLSANIMQPLFSSFSGELEANVDRAPLGAARTSGIVTDVWLSIGASGKDDSAELQVSGEVFINGVTCLTTKPSITHVSGEASQNKTTKVPGDTGIAQGVIDTTANSFSVGDSFSYDLTVVRTGGPTTEMSNPTIVVELEPNM